MHLRGKGCRPCGFTRADLLALTTALFVLGLFLTPGYGQSLRNGQLATCMNNLRQLTQAWQLFAEANDGALPRNLSRTEYQGLEATVWARGWLSWQIESENTNTTLLTGAALGPYIDRNPRVFKCPSDVYLSQLQRTRYTERARSYSMNGFVGRSRAEYFIDPNQQYHAKVQDIRPVSPDKLFVFIEEHPDSINDPVFWLDPTAPRAVDLPAGYHLHGSAVAFADGHVEHKIWEQPETVPPMNIGVYNPQSPRAPYTDYNWLKSRATARWPQ